MLVKAGNGDRRSETDLGVRACPAFAIRAKKLRYRRFGEGGPGYSGLRFAPVLAALRTTPAYPSRRLMARLESPAGMRSHWGVLIELFFNAKCLNTHKEIGLGICR